MKISEWINKLKPSPKNPGCCHQCRKEWQEGKDWREITVAGSFMILCPECGNKRCPKANSHHYDCTGSNEPNQPGSAYQYPT